MANSLRRCWLVFVCAVFAIGCSSGDYHESRKAPQSLAVAKLPTAPAESGLVSVEQNEQPAGEKKEDAAKKAPPIPRKVQYVAEFRLVTDDFAKAEESLHKVVEEFGGFISFADVYTEAGTAAHGTWKARIPVEKFEPFRRAIIKIGDVLRGSVQTQDMTGEYYDLENHIKNQMAQEEAMRDLLKKTTDTMQNMLTVRRELADLRNQIERSEGRMRLLANLTDLTTVTINLQERAKYDPERPSVTEEEPPFSERASKYFHRSWSVLVACAQALAIAILVMAPWLPLVAIAAGIGWLVYRKLPKLPKPAVAVAVAEKPASPSPTI
jgi:hypothetical protein